MKVDCTTADASPGSSDFILLGQKIEGQNLQHLDFGSSSAKQLTYSFWVRSAKTGTHVLEFFQDGNSRQVSATYTVSAANTWEHKEVTIDGDTASALANDTGSELAVYHWLGGGSNFTSGTLNTSGFAAVTNANRAPGTINIADSTSNEFYLTGAQLEVGNTATPFEHRSFADELARCQRYYFRIGPLASQDYFGICEAESSTSSILIGEFPVTLRVDPTALEQTGTAGDYVVRTGGSSRTCSSIPLIDVGTNKHVHATSFTVASGQTAGHAGFVRAASVTDAFLAWSVEL